MLTGPLPERVDYLKLVSDRAVLQGIIPLHRFSRLAQLLENDNGNVQVRLEFQKARKRRALVVGHASIETRLICQTCLLPLTVPVEVTVRLNLVRSNQALFELNQDEDGLVVEDSLVALVDLIEDELIVNLPMVPRHETACYEETVERPIQAETGETQRPFAALSEMQKETSSTMLKKESN